MALQAQAIGTQAQSSAATVAAVPPMSIPFRVKAPLSAMPWEAGLEEDARFKRWLMHGAGVGAIMALLVFLTPQPQQTAQPVEEHREQYAQLVIEEKYVPPPVVEPVPEPIVEPVVEKVKPKEAPQQIKPKPKAPQEVVKPKPPVKQVSEAELRAKAREKAANSGLLALSDQLSSMRQKASTASVSQLNDGGNKASSVKRELIAAKSGAALSGGAAISQQAAGVSLAGREKSAVVVSEAAVAAVEASTAASQYQQSRSADEVRRVMDANKGGIYSVYNRALRKNPSLQGSFSFSMVIEPSGAISSVSMLNSELADAALEKRLLARIRMIKFESADVGSTPVNYSFDFLPN